jgi:hypothetical protein
MLITLFAVQNTAPVAVNLLFWRVEEVPVSLMVLAAAAIGALLTYLFGLSRGIRSRLALRGTRSTIRDQETLIADLRTQVRDLEREVASRGSGVGGRESGMLGEPTGDVALPPPGSGTIRVLGPGPDVAQGEDGGTGSGPNSRIPPREHRP